jgi:hypothetical protein
MAIMIPESIESLDGVTAGEIRVFKLFRELLPDNYYVWYDTMVQNRYPDFIILGPDLGIIVIEVKDWEMGSIISANADYFELRTTGRRPPSPLNQAKAYMRAILDLFKNTEELKENQGKYKGNLCFNYGHGVVLPKIYSREFEEKQFKNVFPENFVMYKDVLDHLSNTRDRGDLLERLKKMIPSGACFTQLSDMQVEIIKSVLSRENVPGEEGTPVHGGDKIKIPNSTHKHSPANQIPVKRKSLHYLKVATIILVVGIVGWSYIASETTSGSITTDTPVAAVQGDLKNSSMSVQHQTKPTNTQIQDKQAPAETAFDGQKPTAGTTSGKTANEKRVQVATTLPKVELPKARADLSKRENVWIKGNINLKGEKVYHLPKDKYYSQTRPEAWFKTEEEAVNAGYRKAKDFWIKGNIGKNGEKIYHMPGQKYYEKTTAEEWFKAEEEAVSAGYRKSKI